MAFPQDPLDIEVRLLLDGESWTDISQFVYTRDSSGGIEIARGRKDWSQRTDFGTCSMQIDNTDLRFSPRNPLGPYYGQLGRNTPVEVSVMTGDPYLALPVYSTGVNIGQAFVEDIAAIDITGDIDVRIDAELLNWFDPGAALDTVEIIGKFDGTTQESWFLGVRDNVLHFEHSADGSTAIEHQSTVSPLPAPGGRLAVRVTMDVDDGSGNHVVTFYTAPNMDAGDDTEWDQLGDPVTTAGTTSIFNSTAHLRIGNATNFGFGTARGRVFRAEVRSGIAGAVVADPDFTIQTVGDEQFTDAAGRTWNVANDAEITNRQVRFAGEIPEWPIDQDTSGNDIWMEVEASGRLRRLRSNSSPVQSTLRRRIPTYNPLAYWPLEDGEESTQAASPIDGVRPLLLRNVDWASNDTLVASDALPVLASNGTDLPTLRGVVPTGTASTEWTVKWMQRLDTANTTLRTYMRIYSTGTVQQWLIQIRNDLTRVIGIQDDGTTLFTDDTTTGSDLFNQWNEVRMDVSQNGGNVDWQLTFIDVGGEGGSAVGSYAGTVGRPIAVTSPGDGYHADLDGLAIGHISVWDDLSDGDNAYEDAVTAWSGETAASRLDRVAAEEGIEISLAASFTDTHTMGGQRAQPLYEVLQDTADVDGGILYEHRWDNRLAYRDRISLYNQTPKLVLDYTADGHVMPPLRPKPDDQNTKNDVTVTRTSASSYRTRLEEGPLSILEHPNGVGPYPDGVTLKLETDDQARAQAGWRLHLGTVDEDRYAEVNVWLQSAPSLEDQVLSVDSGDRMQIENPPGKFQYDTIDLLVGGYREFINQYRWEFSFLCEPASPWDVAHAGEEDAADFDVHWSWVDTTGTELVEALSTTETDVDVITTSGPRWTADHNDSPFLWTVAGETVRVDAPGGFTEANPYFDTATTGWTATNCTIARSTAVVHQHPLAVASLLVTPTAAGTATATGTLTAVGTVNPGGLYTASAWVYSPSGYTDIRPVINWYNSAGTFISQSAGSAIEVGGGVWTLIEQQLTAPATASRLEIAVAEADTPAAGDIFYVWAARASRYKASVIYDDFGRTSTDTWDSADSGQAWTNTGGAAADYDVLTGFGRHIATATSSGRQSTITSVDADSDMYVDVTTAALSTGASQFMGPIARFADVNNLYQARVAFTTANAVVLSIRERVAAVETELGTFTTGFTHVAGTNMRVRFQVIGSALKAKIWPASRVEPSAWNIEVTDTSLTAAGSTGVKSVRDAGNTNANAEFRYDNLDLRNPQTFTVTRSHNGVVKTQSAGAAIKLRHPAIIAL
jgi:hypothetical protein